MAEISSNRLSVEDIVSASTDNRKIGDISPIFHEILFHGCNKRVQCCDILQVEEEF